MKTGPDISRVAALIGDPARAAMLAALTDGRALTASELALEAGVTKQTASAHLSRLLDGGLVACEAQGRHRYFRLEDEDVAAALEALMCVAAERTGRRARPGPKDPALREARLCYDHLAGARGVALLDGLISKRWIKRETGGLLLSQRGADAMHAFGLDTDRLAQARRPVARACLDWSMRRHHLAGGLGAAIFARFVELKWARAAPGSRIVRFTSEGERALAAWLS